MGPDVVAPPGLGQFGPFSNTTAPWYFPRHQPRRPARRTTLSRWPAAPRLSRWVCLETQVAPTAIVQTSEATARGIDAATLPGVLRERDGPAPRPAGRTGWAGR